MDFVEGPILRRRPRRRVFPDEAERRAIGERVVDTLVEIHAVDPDAVGLGELAKKEDYVARQLHRWHGPVGEAEDPRAPARRRGPRPARRADPRAGPGDDRPRRLPPRQHDPGRLRRGRRRRRLGALHARRPARRRRPAARLLGRGGRRADPAVGARRRCCPGSSAATRSAARYAERSGRDLSEIDFYVALGHWKLAIILEGVYARYSAASTATRTPASRSSPRSSSGSPRPPTRPRAGSAR